MQKSIYKKCLSFMDDINGKDLLDCSLEQILKQKLEKNEYHTTIEDLQVLVTNIKSMGLINVHLDEVRAIPCACIFAKCDNGSITEALALLECLLKQQQRDVIINLLKNNAYQDKSTLISSLSPVVFDLLKQTIALECELGAYRLNPVLIMDISNILEEHKTQELIVSCTLSAIYTNELLNHEPSNLEYRNINNPIIEYNNLSLILKIISRKGIPENRDATRAIQSFYKDTLMHEFHHSCPICGIDIPHMLIASHIKPFRDCAHIFETLDHNNGLLLCRNHDYLFDQGFISIDQNGKLLLCKELSMKKDIQHVFTLDTNASLNPIYMSENRKLFLAYHRNHIYKN